MAEKNVMILMKAYKLKAKSRAVQELNSVINTINQLNTLIYHSRAWSFF